MASAGMGWFFGGGSSAASPDGSGAAFSHNPDVKTNGENADEPQRKEDNDLTEEVAKLRTSLRDKEMQMSNLEVALRKRDKVRLTINRLA